MVSVSKTLEHSVDLLCLLGELDLHQQLAYGHVDWVTKEGELAHVTAQDGQEKGIVGLAEVASDDALVEIVGLDSLQIVARGFAFFPSWQMQRFTTNVHRILVR